MKFENKRLQDLTLKGMRDLTENHFQFKSWLSPGLPARDDEVVRISTVKCDKFILWVQKITNLNVDDLLL